MRKPCLSKKERKEVKDRFYRNHAQKVLTYDGLFYPVLQEDHLRHVMQKASVYPDILRKVLESLVEEGVLDYSQEGNYSIESLLSPGFSVNPSLHGRTLYFVSERDCSRYFSEMGLVRPGSFNMAPNAQAIKHGDFNLPVEIDPRMWRVLRLKSHDHRIGMDRDNVPEMLVKRGTLSFHEEGNFGVEYDDGKTGCKNLNFFGGEDPMGGYGEREHFFIDRAVAHSYAESLPCPQENVRVRSMSD